MKTKKAKLKWKTVGMPESDHEKLARLAKINHRSISGQIASMVEKCLIKESGKTS